MTESSTSSSSIGSISSRGRRASFRASSMISGDAGQEIVGLWGPNTKEIER